MAASFLAMAIIAGLQTGYSIYEGEQQKQAVKKSAAAQREETKRQERIANAQAVRAQRIRSAQLQATGYGTDSSLLTGAVLGGMQNLENFTFTNAENTRQQIANIDLTTSANTRNIDAGTTQEMFGIASTLVKAYGSLEEQPKTTTVKTNG